MTARSVIAAGTTRARELAGFARGVCPRVLFGPPAPGDLAVIDIALVRPDARTATASIAPSSTLGSAVAAAASSALRSGRDQLVGELASAPVSS